MSKIRKVVLPIVVVGAGFGAAAFIVKARPETERRAVESTPPVVRVVEAIPRDITLTVFSQGTVRPRTESTLVAQVAGEIRQVGSAFAEGGFFEHGQVLVTIDDSDYELAVARAESQLAQAGLRFEQERAQAAVALEEWEELGTGDASPLTLREPQLAEAKAGVRAAESTLAQAELDLSRTTIRAPFAGRVRAKRADVGQYVSPGSPLADVFSVDAAEVKLPVPQDQLAFLDVPFGAETVDSHARVVLSADLGVEPASWSAEVVRTTGELDSRSRMYTLIARVDDPYRRDTEGPVLPVGLFVDAEITGRIMEDVIRLPRSALREHNRVLVLEEGNRLRFRAIEVLRVQGEEILVGAGLEPGEQICISPLGSVVDGMRVEPMREDRPMAGGA